MAVSGSKNYSITRSDIVESALAKLGVYDQGETIGGDEANRAGVALNLMVKAWVGRGIDLFLRQTVTLFLQPGTESYSLGTSGSAEATTTFVETTLSAAEASGQTVISVTDSTGMTAADRVGIKMDDDTIHWTTIVSVDSSTQITITTATDDDAASGNKVYAYTTKADRPQQILYAYRRDTSGLDTPVRLIGEVEYRNLTDKDAEGQPNQIWYHPTLDTGTLYVWPTDAGASLDKIILITQSLPDDFDAVTDSPEFPIEWGEALVYGLADRLAPEYGIPRMERREIKAEAEYHLETMLNYDVENADVRFTIEREGWDSWR